MHENNKEHCGKFIPFVDLERKAEKVERNDCWKAHCLTQKLFLYLRADVFAISNPMFVFVSALCCVRGVGSHGGIQYSARNV